MVFKFIQSIFNEYFYCKSIMKKQEQFEKTEICWICNKLIEMINSGIIVILLENIEVLHIGIVILI